MEFINEDMRAPAALPVERDAVEHCVRNNQQPRGLELLAEIVDVEYHHTLIQIYIPRVPENIQRAGGIELQRKRNVLRLFFRLHQQLFAQRRERWDDAGFCRLLIELRRAAVDDGFVLRANAALVNLLNQRHDKL